MTEPTSSRADVPLGPADIDSNVPHASRIYDYLLGGTDNFAVDRELAAHMSEAFGGIDNARLDVRANRAFLGRAVRYLAGEADIRQFLDIGTGVPNADNVHAVAQELAPDARIVYVDNDPIVLAHAHSLMRDADPTTTAYLNGDLRDVEAILQKAQATLDFHQPIAVFLVAILHVIEDFDDPHGIVHRLVESVPSGSYLVISHLASDIQAEEQAEAAERLNAQTRETFVLRSHDEVESFFEGTDLLQPGVVRVDQWRNPAYVEPPPGSRLIPIYGAVGHKH
jgi:hypothetical protein